MESRESKRYETKNSKVDNSDGPHKFSLTSDRTKLGSINSMWQRISPGGGSYHRAAPEVWRTGSQRTPEYRWPDCGEVDLQLRLIEIYANYHLEGGGCSPN